jgi:hypothetical protein
LTEEAISSVADATDCTLVEASSDAAATVVASSSERSAVAVNVPAEASSSVEADDTISTISPIIASKSLVIWSTRWPRRIFASASTAAASSAAFLAIRASLKTCSEPAMAPISSARSAVGIVTSCRPAARSPTAPVSVASGVITRRRSITVTPASTPSNATTARPASASMVRAVSRAAPARSPASASAASRTAKKACTAGTIVLAS